MNPSTGKITKESEGYKVTFERLLHHDIRKVWDAITNPQQLALWFTDMEMELQPGAKVTIYFRDADRTPTYGEILRVEPPHVFAFSWEHEIVEYILTEEGEGRCKLKLTHSKVYAEYAASAPAGFHFLLDKLEQTLDGHPRYFAFGERADDPEVIPYAKMYEAFVYNDFPELERHRPVVVEKTYNASVDKVWRAITDKEQMKQWYFDIPEFKAEVGFEFQFYGQGHKGQEYLHLCRITEVEPMKRLSHTWAYQDHPGQSQVTFELSPDGNGTRLKLTHRGLGSFPSDNADFSRNSFNGGWSELIGKLLDDFLNGRKNG